MKKQEIVITIPHSVQIPANEKLEDIIWRAEGPVVLRCDPSEDKKSFQADDLFPDSECLDRNSFGEVLYFKPDKRRASLLDSLCEVFLETYPELEREKLMSPDPDDWSIELRKLPRPSYSSRNILLVDGLEDFLVFSNSKHVSTLICHIACEANFRVMVLANPKRITDFDSLPGFEHLEESNEILCEVSSSWIPPKYIPGNGDEDQKVDKPCMSSNLILGSAFSVSIAALIMAFWVTGHLNSTPSQTVGTRFNRTMETENKAGMRTLSLGSPTEIKWGKPPADKATLDEEIMSNPIPVAFGQLSKEEVEPELSGKLAEKIDIEAIEKYHSKVFEKLDTKSILSTQPIPSEEVFFDVNESSTDIPQN